MLELGRHVVERVRERHQLCRALGAYRLRRPACRQPLRRIDYLSERPGDAAREDYRDDRRERQPDSCGGEQTLQVRPPRRRARDAWSQEDERPAGDRTGGEEPLLAVGRDRPVRATRRPARQVHRRSPQGGDDDALVLPREEGPERLEVPERKQRDALALREQIRL